MKIIMVRHKKKQSQALNKIFSQFVELKKYLKLRAWHSLFARKTLPWYLLLASNDALSQKWLDANYTHFKWRSKINDYNDIVPHANLYVADQAIFIESPSGFWQNPGKTAFKLLNRWQSFCRLLRKVKWLQPLNGVMVLLDFKLLQNEAAFNDYLNNLRAALHDLADASLAKLPVYFFIDGIDALDGFSAYMNKLRPEQKDQVLGMTFNQAKNQQIDIDQFEALFKGLLQQLDKKILCQLPREQTPLVNSEVMHFPFELQQQQKNLKKLLHESSYVTGLKNKLLLRGLYFTAQDYFVKAPLKEVILKEPGLGSAWHGLMHWCVLHKKSVFIGSVIAAILFSLIWLMGTLKADNYLNTVNSELSVYQSIPANTLNSYSQLQSMANLQDENYSYFFRYMGILFPDGVAKKLNTLYARTLHDKVAPMLAEELAQALMGAISDARQQSGTSMDALQSDAVLYNTLSAYLMFNQTQYFDAAAVADALRNYWQASNQDPDVQDTKLSLLTDLNKVGVVPLNLDNNLIAQARTILGQQPLSVQAFFALKANLDSQLKSQVLGGSNNNLFIYHNAGSVDGIYTTDGQVLFNKSENNGVLTTLKASWVLGASQNFVITDANVKRFSEQVSQFYQAQYINSWHSVLWGMSVRPFNDLRDAVAALNDFNNQSGAWQTLNAQVSANLVAMNNQDLTQLKNYFANTQNQDAIIKATTAMSQVLAQVKSSDDAVVLSTQLLNHQVDAFNQMQSLAQSAPQPVKTWLNQLLANSTQAVFNAAQGMLVNNWRNNVSASCKKLVGYGFPTVPASYQDLSINDFAKMFKPGGVINNFSNAHIAALMQALSRNTNAYGAAFNLPLWMQNNFMTIAQIQNAFFAGHSGPALNMQWTPLYLSKNVALFNLSFGNQSLMYQNGPRLSQNILWPQGGQSVSIKFTGLNGRTYSQNYQGTWALLRLLKNAQVKRISPNNYQVTLGEGAYNATYQVKLNQGDFAGVMAVSRFSCGN